MIHLKETLRKSIHIGSLSIPLFYRYVLGFEQRDWMSYLLLAAFMVSMVIEFQRFWQKSFRKTFWKIFGIVLRKHEVRDFCVGKCIDHLPPKRICKGIVYQ